MNVEGIPVVLDPKLTNNFAMARGFWPFKRIAVGPPWYTLPVGERVAILYHEAAHCRRFHLEQRALFVLSLFIAGSLWPPIIIGMILAATAFGCAQWIAKHHEFEADRFAAERGWGVDLRAWLSRQNAPESDFYPSCAERAAALKEASCKP